MFLGRYAGSAQKQIVRVSDKHGLPGHDLVKACRLAGRVDNNAVQDGFGLYQQYFILSDEGEWTSISQGMNKTNRRAVAITGTHQLSGRLRTLHIRGS